MIEILIAIGIFLILVLVAVGGEFVHWRYLLIFGASSVALGLTVGVAMGIAYHFALYRALASTGLLGVRWWLHPTRYNNQVPAAQKRAVMGWFYLGVTSMIIVLVGCGLVLTGILMMRNQ
ncbi:MAG: hypothetical protein GTO40_02195 [Deltaproteobacteria bacterium]|nr:hypothetical protein [Deltaproteobacteria bacterium]